MRRRKRTRTLGASQWRRLHREVLRRLNEAGQIDWTTSVVDGSHIRALQGGLDRPSPLDHARLGYKHSLPVDASGIPLAVSLTGGNLNDVTQLLPLIHGVGPIAGKVGRLRRRPDKLIGLPQPRVRASSAGAGSPSSEPALSLATSPG